MTMTTHMPNGARQPAPSPSARPSTMTEGRGPTSHEMEENNEMTLQSMKSEDSSVFSGLSAPSKSFNDENGGAEHGNVNINGSMGANGSHINSHISHNSQNMHSYGGGSNIGNSAKLVSSPTNQSQQYSQFSQCDSMQRSRISAYTQTPSQLFMMTQAQQQQQQQTPPEQKMYGQPRQDNYSAGPTGYSSPTRSILRETRYSAQPAAQPPQKQQQTSFTPQAVTGSSSMGERSQLTSKTTETMEEVDRQHFRDLPNLTDEDTAFGNESHGPGGARGAVNDRIGHGHGPGPGPSHHQSHNHNLGNGNSSHHSRGSGTYTPNGYDERRHLDSQSPFSRNEDDSPLRLISQVQVQQSASDSEGRIFDMLQAHEQMMNVSLDMIDEQEDRSSSASHILRGATSSSSSIRTPPRPGHPPTHPSSHSQSYTPGHSPHPPSHANHGYNHNQSRGQHHGHGDGSGHSNTYVEPYNADAPERARSLEDDHSFLTRQQAKHLELTLFRAREEVESLRDNNEQFMAEIEQTEEEHQSEMKLFENRTRQKLTELKSLYSTELDVIIREKDAAILEAGRQAAIFAERGRLQIQQLKQQLRQCKEESVSEMKDALNDAVRKTAEAVSARKDKEHTEQFKMLQEQYEEKMRNMKIEHKNKLKSGIQHAVETTTQRLRSDLEKEMAHTVPLLRERLEKEKNAALQSSSKQRLALNRSLDAARLRCDSQAAELDSMKITLELTKRKLMRHHEKRVENMWVEQKTAVGESAVRTGSKYMVQRSAEVPSSDCERLLNEILETHAFLLESTEVDMRLETTKGEAKCNAEREESESKQRELKEKLEMLETDHREEINYLNKKHEDAMGKLSRMESTLQRANYERADIEERHAQTISRLKREHQSSLDAAKDESLHSMDKNTQHFERTIANEKMDAKRNKAAAEEARSHIAQLEATIEALKREKVAMTGRHLEEVERLKEEQRINDQFTMSRKYAEEEQEVNDAVSMSSGHKHDPIILTTTGEGKRGSRATDSEQRPSDVNEIVDCEAPSKRESTHPRRQSDDCQRHDGRVAGRAMLHGDADEHKDEIQQWRERKSLSSSHPVGRTVDRSADGSADGTATTMMTTPMKTLPTGTHQSDSEETPNGPTDSPLKGYRWRSSMEKSSPLHGHSRLSRLRNMNTSRRYSSSSNKSTNSNHRRSSAGGSGNVQMHMIDETKSPSQRQSKPPTNTSPPEHHEVHRNDMRPSSETQYEERRQVESDQPREIAHSERQRHSRDSNSALTPSLPSPAKSREPNMRPARTAPVAEYETAQPIESEDTMHSNANEADAIDLKQTGSIDSIDSQRTSNSGASYNSQRSGHSAVSQSSRRSMCSRSSASTHATSETAHAEELANMKMMANNLKDGKASRSRKSRRSSLRPRHSLPSAGAKKSKDNKSDSRKPHDANGTSETDEPSSVGSASKVFKGLLPGLAGMMGAKFKGNSSKSRKSMLAMARGGTHDEDHGVTGNQTSNTIRSPVAERAQTALDSPSTNSRSLKQQPSQPLMNVSTINSTEDGTQVIPETSPSVKTMRAFFEDMAESNSPRKRGSMERMSMDSTSMSSLKTDSGVMSPRSKMAMVMAAQRGEAVGDVASPNNRQHGDRIFAAPTDEGRHGHDDKERGGALASSHRQQQEYQQTTANRTNGNQSSGTGRISSSNNNASAAGDNKRSKLRGRKASFGIFSQIRRNRKLKGESDQPRDDESDVSSAIGGNRTTPRQFRQGLHARFESGSEKNAIGNTADDGNDIGGKQQQAHYDGSAQPQANPASELTSEHGAASLDDPAQIQREGATWTLKLKKKSCPPDSKLHAIDYDDTSEVGAAGLHGSEPGVLNLALQQQQQRQQQHMAEQGQQRGGAIGCGNGMSSSKLDSAEDSAAHGMPVDEETAEQEHPTPGIHVINGKKAPLPRRQPPGYLTSLSQPNPPRDEIFDSRSEIGAHTGLGSQSESGSGATSSISEKSTSFRAAKNTIAGDGGDQNHNQHQQRLQQQHQHDQHSNKYNVLGRLKSRNAKLNRSGINDDSMDTEDESRDDVSETPLIQQSAMINRSGDSGYADVYQTQSEMRDQEGYPSLGDQSDDDGDDGDDRRRDSGIEEDEDERDTSNSDKMVYSTSEVDSDDHDRYATFEPVQFSDSVQAGYGGGNQHIPVVVSRSAESPIMYMDSQRHDGIGEGPGRSLQHSVGTGSVNSTSGSSGFLRRQSEFSAFQAPTSSSSTPPSPALILPAGQEQLMGGETSSSSVSQAETEVTAHTARTTQKTLMSVAANLKQDRVSAHARHALDPRRLPPSSSSASSMMQHRPQNKGLPPMSASPNRRPLAFGFRPRRNRPSLGKSSE